MLSHELDDQFLCAQVTEFIAVRDFKADYALERRLRYFQNLSTLQMLACEHAEIRRRERRLPVLRHKINQRERGGSAHEEPIGDFVILYGEQQLIFFRLHDAADTASDKAGFKLVPDGCCGDSVKCHATSIL